MKKFCFLIAVAVLSAFTAFSQCTEGGILYADVVAPCSESPPVSANIAGFEVWRGDIYEIFDVKVGGNYIVDICQKVDTITGELIPTGGGADWSASLTIVAPSGAIMASGLDAGSICELSFTATEAGTHEIYINEVGECPGVAQEVNNGAPRVTYTGGADCGPVVTACEAGVVDAAGAPASLCPGEQFLYTVNTFTIPTGGDLAIQFDPVPGSGTGGFVGGPAFPLGITGLVGGTIDDTLNVFLDNLDGLAPGVILPLEGEWNITTFIFDAVGVCDSTDVITVDFLNSGDPGCTPVTTCEAGILDQAGIDNELCPSEATDYAVTGITIPNTPVAGEYILEFTPVPGSGSGGPFGANPDPSFILTLGGVGAGDENVDVTISLDAELLTTGAAQPALMGEWNVRGGVFTDGAFPCDSVPNVVINFKGVDEFPCGGPAPCENPYPAVDQASLTVVENPSGSISVSWDPIPGQIGCQVQALIGGVQTVGVTVIGANASQINPGPGLLTPFTTYDFRVRCGCQAFPSLIVGPFTEYVPLFYFGPGSLISATDLTPAAMDKYAHAYKIKNELFLSDKNKASEMIEPTFDFSGASTATISKMASKKTASFDVFPNPSTGAVNLKYQAGIDGLVNVRVFDVVGKAVADFNMSVNEGSNFLRLDLSSLDRGVYVIQVTEGQTSSSSKVVLE